MKKLTILQTSDTHGYLNELSFQTSKPVPYGLSRVATYIKQVKSEEKTIVIDTGDTIQGSPLMYFYKNHMNQFENPVSSVLNEIGYDYLVPGNHDFNYGMNYFNDFKNTVNGTFLCGNILRNNKSFVGAAYDIISLENGLKIAVIGITTNYIPVWEKHENIEGLIFEDAFEATKKIVRKIKTTEDVACIVLGYHGGFEMNLDTHELESKTTENLGMKMFLELPEIDIILSGHQHRVISKQFGKRVLSQPGANASFVSRIDISFDLQDKWVISSIDNSLVTVGDYQPDKKVTSILSNIMSKNDVFLDELIGLNKNADLEVNDHLNARLNKHKIVDLINKIQLEVSNADISCMALGNTSTGFKKEISIRDVLNTYVYPNTLVVVEIDGLNLRKALERNATFFDLNNDVVSISKSFKEPKLEYYNYDMFSNIDYTIDLRKRIGNRITSITYNGQQIQDANTFSLVMSSYRFSGGGEFEMYEGLKVVKEIPLDISEVIIDYIKLTKDIDVESENNIKIIY